MVHRMVPLHPVNSVPADMSGYLPVHSSLHPVERDPAAFVHRYNVSYDQM